jgi:LPXTG-site transpeptidase (sortase) family protein
MNFTDRFAAHQSNSILIIPVIVSLLFFAPAASAQSRTATISIPSINVQAPVFEIYVRAFADGSVTWDTNGLQNNVGHLEGTSWFGEAGNTVLAGHSELAARQPSVFVSLNQVKTGDVIVIDENGSQKQYAVTSVSGRYHRSCPGLPRPTSGSR